MSNKFVTLTITPDLTGFHRALRRVTEVVEQSGRTFRAFGAQMNGKSELALVISEQPGRQIVRDGMADVLHWLGECECHTPCDYAKGQA